MHLDATGRRGWEAERPSFQTFHPYRKAVSIPIEYLHAIAPAIAKNEEVAGKRVLPDDRRGQGRQTVEGEHSLLAVGLDEPGV
jgi:hypothetical protein